MTQRDILVLADEYAAAVAAYATGISRGEDSMSPLARDAGDKRRVLAEAIAAARVQALEEAAMECDRTASDYKGMFAEDESLYIAATDCANEMRALIGAKT